ncbi:MAG TPA: DUF3800 domain-containing protein [Clostridia bacterium]
MSWKNRILFGDTTDADYVAFFDESGCADERDKSSRGFVLSCVIIKDNVLSKLNNQFTDIKNSFWENGENLIKLARLFDVTTNDILGLENEDGTKIHISNNFNNNGKINFNLNIFWR